jgi:putative ABC transport system substrate-binding protein
MNRRSVLILAAGAVLAPPRVAFAQAVRKVAVMFAGDPDADEPAARAFFDEMQRLGWKEGANIAYERLTGRGTREYVEKLVEIAASDAPHLILASTGTTAVAAAKAARSIPIVFVTASDPAGLGLVASLARPGGNASGVYQHRDEAIAKRFELVRETFPQLTRIGVLLDRRAAEYPRQRSNYLEAARRAGLEPSPGEFANYEAVARVLSEFRKGGITVAAVTPSYTLIGRRREVCNAALFQRIALVAHRSDWVEAGAVVSFGVDIAESLRQAAAIADRILRGARPGEIPVAEPSKFELAVNLVSAKRLGLTIPQGVRGRADRVIA